MLKLICLVTFLFTGWAMAQTTSVSLSKSKKARKKALAASEAKLAAPLPADAPRAYRIEPTAGMACSAITGAPGKEMIHGYRVGALVDVGRGPVRFQTGGLWTQMGTSASPNRDRTVEITSTYLAIPADLVAKIYGDKNQLYCKVGVMPAFRLNSSFQTTGLNAKSGYSRGFKDFDFLASLSVGFQMPIAPNRDFRMELAFARGFVDVRTHADGGQDLFNESFSLSAGVAL